MKTILIHNQVKLSHSSLIHCKENVRSVQQHGGHGLGPSVHGHGVVGGGGESAGFAPEGGGEGLGVGGDGAVRNMFQSSISFSHHELPHWTFGLLLLL